MLGENVWVTESFIYLVSVISGSVLCEPEVIRRIGLAYGVMGSQDSSVWLSRYLSRGTKLQCVFGSVVLASSPIF